MKNEQGEGFEVNSWELLQTRKVVVWVVWDLEYFLLCLFVFFLSVGQIYIALHLES